MVLRDDSQTLAHLRSLVDDTQQSVFEQASNITHLFHTNNLLKMLIS
jgi:hypothetical protein